jgi:hypothetical protein
LDAMNSLITSESEEYTHGMTHVHSMHTRIHRERIFAVRVTVLSCTIDDPLCQIICPECDH